MPKKNITKYRIFKNLSYIPGKPHRIYYNNTPVFSSNSRNVIQKNTFDAFHYLKLHEQIKHISKNIHLYIYVNKKERIQTIKTAISIWATIKVIVRSVLDRVYELYLSSVSYFVAHENFLNETLLKNKIFMMENIKTKFIRKFKGHINDILEQTGFLIKNLDFYKQTILKFIDFSNKDIKIKRKTSAFISRYINNIKRIVNIIHKNSVTTNKKIEDYVTSLSVFIKKFYRVKKKERQQIPMGVYIRDRNNIYNKFLRLKNGFNQDFVFILKIIKSREAKTNINLIRRQETLIKNNRRLPI